MNTIVLAVAVPLLFQIDGSTQQTPSKKDTQVVADNPNIDFAAFAKLARKLEPVRAERRVNLDRFLEMAKEPGTILLDTRSKVAFDSVHLSGAVHLNFSDFTEKKLKETIPETKTRILIYCNNNFFVLRGGSSENMLDPNGNLTGSTEDNEEFIVGTTNKKPALALNIPTFINLWGYGYKNVYELADVVHLDDPKVPLEGSGVKTVEQRDKHRVAEPK